jgi:hypothetical protein
VGPFNRLEQPPACVLADALGEDGDGVGAGALELPPHEASSPASAQAVASRIHRRSCQGRR